jgi:hypothetical protein
MLFFGGKFSFCKKERREEERKQKTQKEVRGNGSRQEQNRFIINIEKKTIRTIGTPRKILF